MAANIYQTIINAESGGKNVNNYRFDSTHTASGYFQITDTTWMSTPAGQASGVTHAMDAPFATQQNVAGQLIARNGLNDWAPYDHINSNVSSYDQTKLSGPGGSPVSSTTAGQGGSSDASTLTSNGDGTYTRANGTTTDKTPTTSSGGNITKADPSELPKAVATGADEQTAGATADTKTLTDSNTANTKSIIAKDTSLSAIWGSGLVDAGARIGFVILGLVLLAGGLWILASEESGGAIPGPKKVAKAAAKIGRTVVV